MNKYILVTASSKGLGLEIAKQLSFAKYNIILTSRSKKNLKDARNLLNPKQKHKLIKIDFTKDDIDKKLIKKIKKLDIHSIIHNFGTNLVDDTHPIDIDILNKSIYNNFTVSLKINNSFVKYLTAKPSKIIHIGSTASLHAKASPAYTLSKSLINSYVKNISNIYIKNNIMICAILPGILAHKDSVWDKKRVTDTDKYNEVKSKQPLGRFLTPSDIAEYIVDLVDKKSLAFSGSILKLDANDY
jgi:short-subunit dehydrogenase